MAAYSLGPALYHLDPSTIQRDSTVLLALTAGLLASVVAESATNLYRAVAILATVQAAYAIYGSFWDHNHSSIMVSGSVTRTLGTLGSPEQVGAVMIFGIPLAMALSIKNTRGARFFWLACALVELTALILTWDRAEILGAAVGGIWFFSRMVSDKRRVLLFGTLCLLAVLSAVTFRGLGLRNQESADGSDRGHLMLMRDGLYHFEKHWLTGGGMQQVQHLLIIDPAVRYPPSYYKDPKCLLIVWLDEMGIVGGVLFALLTYSVASVIGRNRNTIATGAGAAWLAIWISGLFDTPFGLAQLAPATAMAGSLLGVVLFLNAEDGKGKEHASVSGTERFYAHWLAIGKGSQSKRA